MAGSPLLVDVRERDEFAMIRVPGTVLMPLTQVAMEFQKLPRDRPLLLMCAAGSRSRRAGEFLLANGFPDVTNVAGGIIAWQAAGLPVIGGAPEADEGALPEPK